MFDFISIHINLSFPWWLIHFLIVTCDLRPKRIYFHSKYFMNTLHLSLRHASSVCVITTVTQRDETCINAIHEKTWWLQSSLTWTRNSTEHVCLMNVLWCESLVCHQTVFLHFSYNLPTVSWLYRVMDLSSHFTKTYNTVVDRRLRYFSHKNIECHFWTINMGNVVVFS